MLTLDLCKIDRYICEMSAEQQHTRGFVRAFGRRYPSSGQRATMDQHGVKAIYAEGEGKQHSPGAMLDAFIKSLRGGDLACVVWLPILANPTLPPAKRRESLRAAIEAIEDRSAIIWELATGLRSDDRKQRDQMIAAAYEAITTGRVARPGVKAGRPPKWKDPADRKIIWEEWHSNINKSNTLAAKAASARLGRKIGQHTMWRIIREMRREGGDADAGGRSGRSPGPAFSRLTAKGRRVRERVYFIKSGTAVKIGYTTDVVQRMAAFDTSHPEKVKLLATQLGDISLERQLHKRFADLRIRGEWFKYQGALARYINALRKKPQE